MTKSTSLTRHSSSGGRKRPKRPRNERSYDKDIHRASGTTSSETVEAADKPEINVSEEGKNQNSSQRLYHGVCPDVSNRYRKVGGGRIGQGTYGVVYLARDTWKEKEMKENTSLVRDGSEKFSRTPPRDKKRNEIVALKKCYAHHEASDGFPVTTLREIQALRICSRHPNIVDLVEIAVSSSTKESNDDSDDHNNDECGSKPKATDTIASSTATQKATVKIGKSNVFLVFEHCRYDLAHILDSYHEHRRNRHSKHRGASSPFSLPQIKTLVLQLLSALEFCHSHWLVHRDIKPSNLLYDTTTGRLKVCDFGLSRIASSDHMTPNVVSLWYRAPELIISPSSSRRESDEFEQRIKYSFPIDLWAVGCVVAELLKGRPFLDGTTEMEQLEKMQDALGPPPIDLYSVPLRSSSKSKSKSNKHHSSMGLWDRFEYLGPDGLTLLARLMDYDPNGRWTAARAQKASFLAPTSSPPPITDLRSMPRNFPGC